MFKSRPEITHSEHCILFYAADFISFLPHPNHFKNNTILNLGFYGCVANHCYWQRRNCLIKIIIKRKSECAQKSNNFFSFWLCPSQQSMHHCFTDISWLRCLTREIAFLLKHMLTNIDLLCLLHTKWVSGNAQ